MGPPVARAAQFFKMRAFVGGESFRRPDSEFNARLALQSAKGFASYMLMSAQSEKLNCLAPVAA
jgi:hypothetical protein